MIALNPNRTYKIQTPIGWESFTGIQKLIKPAMVELIFEENLPVFRCSPNHPLQTPEGTLTLAADLIEGDPLKHETLGFVTVKSIVFIDGDVILYDILDAGLKKLYYTNGLISHNCEFIGSSNTLISVECLTGMASKPPIRKVRMKFSIFQTSSGGSVEHFLDVHADPLPTHQYVLCADVAGGKDQDASAFVIFDVTCSPYLVVAKYQSNKISPMLFSDVIADAASQYNMAFVLVETNDNDVAKTLQMDLESENIITTTEPCGKGDTGWWRIYKKRRVWYSYQ